MLRASTGASCSSSSPSSTGLDAQFHGIGRRNLQRAPAWNHPRKFRARATSNSNAWTSTTYLSQMRVDASDEKLMNDDYARLFSADMSEASDTQDAHDGAGRPPTDWTARSYDLLATKFVDESVLNIASMVNMNREQEYSQVVLIGDGSCTRFCRLPWPQGTVIFLVAPAEVHERAEAILAASSENAVAPRGCMLRRVDCDLTGAYAPNGLVAALEAKGFRGSKLSVFALQGLRAMDVSQAACEWIFSEISDAAAFESIVVGEIKAGSAGDLERLAAGYGMQGNEVPLATVRDQCIPRVDIDPRWLTAIGDGGDKDGTGAVEVKEWRLFRATQRRLSLEEMETLALHSAAAEEVDEDFFGNFS